MKRLRRMLSSWQGWMAGCVAAGLYFICPWLIRRIDPAAGEFPPAFDLGLLQLLALAALIYFATIAVTWAGWQIAFRSLDRLYDREVERLYRSMPDWLAVVLIQGSFVLMGLAWMWAISVALELIR